MKKIAVIIAIVALAGIAAAENYYIKDFLLDEENYFIRDNERNPGNIGPIALGDVNGDGYDDLIMGAPRAIAQGADDTGILYVRFGLNFGEGSGYIPEPGFDLSSTTTLTTDPTLSSVAFDDDYGRPAGIQVNGEVDSRRFGYSLAAGDFNGDGFDDIACHMHDYFEPEGPGRVYLIKGRSDISGLLDLENERQNQRSFYIYGRSNGDRFGRSLFFADLDNDGKEDLFIGSPNAGDGGDVDIIYGREFSVVYSQFIDAIPMPRTRLSAESADDSLGFAFASGDLNGDGITDVCIGAPDHSGYEYYAGKGYIIQGRNRISETRDPLPNGTLDLSATTRTIELVSRVSLESAGSSFAVGDLNNDGLNDLAIGAPRWSNTDTPNRGRVYVLFNDGEIFQNRGASVEISLADVRFSPFNDPDRLGTKLAFVNFDGFSGDDLIITAPYDDPVDRSAAGSLRIVTGSSDPEVFSKYNYNIESYTRGFFIKGQQPGDFMGQDLTVGDFNGDDRGDFFVSGSGANATGKCVWGMYGSNLYRPLGADGNLWLRYE